MHKDQTSWMVMSWTIGLQSIWFRKKDISTPIHIYYDLENLHIIRKQFFFHAQAWFTTAEQQSRAAILVQSIYCTDPCHNPSDETNSGAVDLAIP